ncbi:hypothetical protein WJX79_008916 [Trebouxia sp. C0005]|nr:MAG: hypothetical protein FRX49_01917 [Trebouxia sp. A1-2]
MENDRAGLLSHSGPVGTSAAALQPEERDEQIQLPYYDSAQDPVAFIRERAKAFVDLPSIYRRRSMEELDIAEELQVEISDWHQIKRIRPTSHVRRTAIPDLSVDKAVQKVSKVSKAKGQNSGRTYTSKYRGVHQTFPTKRWEAQFRRCGKPTSLGCFDHEEQAARAYDKMMLWCELHNSSGVKGGITNFDPAEYEKDLSWLQVVNQDELVTALRGDGRRQAAQRMLRQKKDGQLVSYDSSGFETASG